MVVVYLFFCNAPPTELDITFLGDDNELTIRPVKIMGINSIVYYLLAQPKYVVSTQELYPHFSTHNICFDSVTSWIYK